MNIVIPDVTIGHRESDGFKFFGRYCDIWIDLMDKYHSKVDDWPFWNGERPLTGFLASAVRINDDAALEEYRADKVTGERGANPYVGRGDLYIHHRKFEGNFEFKKRYIGVTQARDFAPTIKTRWTETSNDASRYNNKSDKIERLGGIFFCPYVHSSWDNKMIRTNLKSLIRCAWDTVSPDVLAWWFPPIALENAKNDWGIGIMLLIKRVK